MRKNEPEREELKGEGANPPLTRAELQELQNIIQHYSESHELSKDDSERATVLFRRFQNSKRVMNK